MKQKLEQAKKLLQEIRDNWSEDNVEHYGSSMSFDELVREVEVILLKN